MISVFDLQKRMIDAGCTVSLNKTGSVYLVTAGTQEHTYTATGTDLEETHLELIYLVSVDVAGLLHDKGCKKFQSE
jgi:hypothetical protein